MARFSRRALVGAAFASCVITSLPGLTITLHNLGRTLPDVQATLFEILPGILAAAFGASRLRENPLLRKRLPSVLLLLAIAFVTFIECFGALFAVASGTMEGGIVLVAGLGIIAILVAVQAVLGGLVWFLLSSLAKLLDRDEGASLHPNARSATWLAVAALIHVVIKGVSGGPVFFGLFAAAVALLLALQTKQTMAMMFAGLAIPLGLGAQVISRVHYAHIATLEALPLCEGDDDTMVGLGTLQADRRTGVLASRARALPGVADAFAFSRSPYGDQELSLVVLPVGGGPIDPTLRKTLEASVANPDCVVDNRGTKPHVTVEDPKYVEIPVLASVHLAPGANADDVKKALAQTLHDSFTPRVGGPIRIVDQSARGLDLPSPTAGATSVVYKSGTDYLESRIDQLQKGEVPTLGKVDITIEP
jgi:hypothetical protein